MRMGSPRGSHAKRKVIYLRMRAQIARRAEEIAASLKFYLQLQINPLAPNAGDASF
jgi:hypothetical protein